LRIITYDRSIWRKIYTSFLCPGWALLGADTVPVNEEGMRDVIKISTGKAFLDSNMVACLLFFLLLIRPGNVLYQGFL
jgi:hypothetical protein